MTNTLNNVPRELLDSLLTVIDSNGYAAAEVEVVDELRGLLSAPSPAGVDGLGNTAKLLLPALRQYMHNDGSGLLVGYDLETTQAAIDGLRGENEALHAQVKALQSDVNSWQSGYDEGRRTGGKHCALTIDQQAQRIGELASHLEFAVTLLTVAGLAGNAQVEAMRAALSASNATK